MPIRVQGPDGSIVEFPDGTAQATMESAMQAHYGKPKAAPQAPDPTDGMNPFQKFAAGVGKSLSDTGHGIVQAGTDAARYAVESNPMIFGDHAADGLKQQVTQQRQDEDMRRKRDAPLMHGAGFAGDVLGQTAQIAVPVGDIAKGATLANTVARGAAFGATQGVGGDETRAGNIGLNAAMSAAGHGLQTAVGAAGRGMANKIAPEVMALYQKAQAAGIPVHFSQLSDSKFVKTLASTLGYLPFTGAGSAATAQQQAFNRAAGRSFGADAGTLTDDVMATARQKLGAAYDGIFNRNNVKLDTQAARDLFALHHAVGNDLEASQAAVARKQIEKVLDNVGQAGEMPGAVYQNLRTQLRENFDPNTALGRQVKAVRAILDEAAKRSLGPQDAKALAQTNGAYANFKTVQDVLKQVEGAKGNIKPAALWNVVKKGSTKDMRELAKIGQVLLKDGIPDSGTAGRLLATGGAGMAGMTGGLAAVTPLAKLLLLGATVGRAANSETAAAYLAHGSKPITGLARLLKPAPYVAPAIANASR